MTCFPGCPDCVESGKAAPVHRPVSGIAPGAACKCFPANEKCPSAVVCCRKQAAANRGPRLVSDLDHPSGASPEGNDGGAGAAHVVLSSGMVRSDDSGKPDYTLIDLAILERLAKHLTAQVPSKGRNNWRLASTEEDRDRFLQSAWRHFVAWQRGDTDEDHAAALIFNVTGAEYVRSQLSR